MEFEYIFVGDGGFGQPSREWFVGHVKGKNDDDDGDDCRSRTRGVVCRGLERVKSFF